MSNSSLRHKTFRVPDKVLKSLFINLKKFSDKRGTKGFNRAINILDKRFCTYEQLKRIKNYFDYVDPENIDEVEYLLNGGDIMKKWVNDTLQKARDSVKGGKRAKSISGMSNQYRKEKDFKIETPNANIKTAPDFMSTSDLMNEIFKIREIYKKLI